MRSRVPFLAALVFTLAPWAVQTDNQVQTDTSQRYVVLDARTIGFTAGARRKNLQQQLDRVSATGYRLAYGDASQILVFEKTLSKYEYRVLGDSWEELRTAAADGFSAIPMSLSSGSKIRIVEKAVGNSELHDYRLLDRLRSKTLQNALNEAATKGYELTAISPDSRTVLMERRMADAIPILNRYLVLATDARNMQKKINEGVETGYAVTTAVGGEELTIVMEKTANAPEYLLLAQHDTDSLEKEIKAAALRCFRPITRTLLFTKHRGDGGFLILLPGTILLPTITNRGVGPIFPVLARRGSQEREGLIIVMKKTPQCEAFEYKVIGTQRVRTFKKELAQVAVEGFEIIGVTFSGEQVALLRRPRG